MDLLSMLQSKAEALSEQEAKTQAEKEKVTEELEKKKEKTLNKELVDRMLKRKKKKAEKVRKRIEEKKKSEKRAAKRKTAAKELLSTETTYVKNLMILINGFVLPLETNGILNATELANLFSNIKVLLKFHKEFLKSLKERLNDEENSNECFGEVILKMTPYLKMYTQYGTNYDTSLATMKNLTATNNKFASFLQENMENPTFGGLTLSGYLIMPIQRIPRYKLLLEVILENTEPTHPDYANLEKGLSEIQSVALTINDAIEKESSMNTLIRLQGMVNLQVVVPARKFIREGTMKTSCFQKKKKKGKGSRHSSEVVVVANTTDSLDRLSGMHYSDPSPNGKRLTASVSLRKLPREKHDEEGPLTSPPPPFLSHRSASVTDLTPLRWTSQIGNVASLPDCNIYLCNDIIIVAHSKNKSKAIAPRLATTWVKHAELFPKSWELVTLEGTFLMVVKDAEEKESWVKSINDAIEAQISKPDVQELRDQYEPRIKSGMWKVVSKNSPHDEDESEESVSKTILHVNPVFNSLNDKTKRGSLIVGGRPASPTTDRRKDRSTEGMVARVRARASTYQQEPKMNTLA